MKAYDIVEELQRLVDAISDTHAFTGRIDASGEDAGDLWRLIVKDRKAVKVEPRIIWPDDPDAGKGE